MNLKLQQIKEMYLDVITEYNTTPLSRNDGWVYNWSDFGFIELQKIAKYLTMNGTFVDIGTGRGIAPRFVKKIKESVISFDSKSAAGSSAIENVKLANIQGEFCDMYNEKLPLSDNSSDLVFFGDVIEHLLHSPKPVLMEFNRILSKEGVVIATTPNACRLTVRLKMLLGYSNWANIYEFFDKDFHPGHHHEYTIDEFKKIFELTGFEIVEFVLYEENLRSEKLKNFTDIKTQDRNWQKDKKDSLFGRIMKFLLLQITNIFPTLRSNMLIIARKK